MEESKKKIYPRYIYNNNSLAAAGILLYDDDNFYYVIENRSYEGKNKIVKIDPGGKFTAEDYHIYQTAAREFCEETFFTIPIDYFLLIKLKKQNKIIEEFVCWNPKEKVYQYLMLLINVKDIPNFKFDKNLIKEKIYNERKIIQNYIISQNTYISTLGFYWASKKNIRLELYYKRLKEVLRKNNLFEIEEEK